MQHLDIEIAYNLKKASPLGETTGFEIYSPVFDLLNLPLPVQGKLHGQSSIQLNSFFLVFSSPERERLCWIPVSDCRIVNHKFKGM